LPLPLPIAVVVAIDCIPILRLRICYRNPSKDSERWLLIPSVSS
jgi:hypothetical protein